MSADNQQERLSLWISGFVDGEGCFHVSLNKMQKMNLGFQVLPEFRVVQHKRDLAVLYSLQNHFGFGKVCRNHGDRFEYRVRGHNNLKKIVCFFETYPLMTTKQINFRLFAYVVYLMDNKKHLSIDGVDLIRTITTVMNRKSLESSETTRQTRVLREDIVRPA